MGWSQARSLAAGWSQAPDLIVTSPFLRTYQTALPTIEQYPHVAVEVWPIQEFTYLIPSRWNGTLLKERLPYIERYWQQADPEYCDGEGAESFGALLRRAGEACRKLEKMDPDAVVYVFSHGQFIQAIKTLILEPKKSIRERMLAFRRKAGLEVIGNAAYVSFVFEQGSWRLSL